MKFAFLTFKYFPYGGMQRDMLRTAIRLSQAGHHVDIFTMSWSGELPQGNIAVHILPGRGWFNFQKYQDFIRQAQAEIASRGGFDLVVGYNRMEGLGAYFAADPCFIERAHRQRNWLYRLTPRYRWFQRMEEAIFSVKADTQMLMVDMAEKAVFQHWYHTQDARFHYIPPYLSAERLQLQDRAEMRDYLRHTFNLPQDAHVALLVGSGFYMKGLDRAVIALAKLPVHLRKNFKLIAIGQDKPEPFIRMARKLGVSDHLIISAGRPDIPQLMQGADFYLHPAYRENTGLVILEAMASGLPVVATASCGYATHVQAAGAGLVVAVPFEQAALEKTLRDMLEIVQARGEQLQAWRENGLRYVQQLMQANNGDAEALILQDIVMSGAVSNQTQESL
ncbi:UDP-glucose:(heptosyl)LPS alpha-1,3-glucosyltransferase [Methylobacillus rhizosphaerae]|uniref:UDP-glucose:(Heptosyl)LPS alpha-1,3-glucosyltransferase n=1 Tax=Methylobacillus rhizosphaerae TaxID=551994 RepID=A0A239AG51_9PROT|nr:glycosyltransferase family 4 protein [Methylobacillus rhizosphaerae]SNR94617.1 UDP-glucose:(heptosyl)LPS alpha-1,3-glucosyltransferase [Methylobacillus rhizosphaerae]